MRVDPFTDTVVFALGETGDHLALGPARYVLVALWGSLVVGSFVIALVNVIQSPAQRKFRHLCLWIIRCLMGSMWFQGALWKLPLPLSGGLQFWTGEMAKYSAFEWHKWIVQQILLPYLAFFNPIVFFTEIGFAVSLILGFATRLGGAVAVLFTLNLWIGLYRHPTEWPWTYVFIMAVHGMLALDRAGYSLGLDAILARRPPANTRLAVAWRLAS